MKKITLLIAALGFAIVATSQNQLPVNAIDLEKNNNNPFVSAERCDQEAKDIRYILERFDTWEYADDLVVPAKTSFSLDLMQVYFAISSGEETDTDDITVKIYLDDNGKPGDEIELENQPDIFAVLDEPEALAGWDVWVLLIDWGEDPVVLEAGSTDTPYWVGIQLPEGGGPGPVTTNTQAHGSEFHINIDDLWVAGTEVFALDGIARDLVFDFYGDCDVLNVGDFEMISFSHYLQDKQLFLESDSTIEQAVIYNLLGQQMTSVSLNSTSASVDLSSFSSGMYLVKLNIEGEVKTFKFIIN